MKNSRKFSIACALMLSLSAGRALSSCSKKPADSIVGKWAVQGQPSTVEFHKDGTLTSNDSGHDSTGTYKFTDATHMTLQIAAGDPNHPMSLPCEIAVNGDTATLTLALPDGPQKGEKKSVQLKRVK